MARYKGILAYDGTEFAGFQRQVNARTVQGVVEAVLHRLAWQGRSILAAGRTDRGVHARGQVVVFDLAWPHPEVALMRALNAHLPADVAFVDITPVAPDFHPRYDALERHYTYAVYCLPVRDPLRERYAWRVWPALDMERLNRAAEALVGEYDFAAFGSPTRQGGTTKRRVFSAAWQAHDEGLRFEIRANAFLYHMVRRLVSMQVSIGQGHQEPDHVRWLLENPNSEISQGLAPPQGLCLTRVIYPA